MSYSDVEPMPEVPPPARFRWVLASLALGWVSLPVMITTGSPWGLALYLPFAIIMPAFIARSTRRYRAYMAASDEWTERMRAYYAAKRRAIHEGTQNWREN